jgi:NADPH:quinone reductase-like Zn-dependent oxidoreductase
MRVETGSGEQGEIGPGDVAAIGPGHDAWVVGDEPCVTVDFGGYAQYAKG